MKMIDMSKKSVRAMLALCLFLTGLFSVVQPVSAAETTGSDQIPKDFVLVIDESGTMDQADPERLCDAAARMFIDMMPMDNSRLAIVTFGKQYGTDAAVINGDYPGMNNITGENKGLVKIAYPLTDITTQDEKNNAKEIITREREGTASTATDYSPVGRALSVANQLLNDWHSAPGSAGIVLMTDGRDTGLDGTEATYESLSDAVKEAAALEHPVYGIELNMDGKNGSDGDYRPVRACKIMRELIPELSGTDPIELKDANGAQEAYLKIFGRFFSGTNSDVTEDVRITDQNGQATFTLDVDEMVAELSITFTGDISSVDSIDIIDPDGNVIESFLKAEGAQQIKPDTNDSIVYEDHYAITKLITPHEGNWKVVTHGSSSIEIGMFAISIRDMNILLTANRDISEEMKLGDVITLEASYIYKDRQYSSERVYANYPAVLEAAYTVDGELREESIPMRASESGYAADYEFQEKSIYKFSVRVENDAFQDGYKYSNSLSFGVATKQTIAVGSMDDAEVGLCGTGAIECKEFFDSQDGDPLYFHATVTPKDEDLELSIDETTGYLSYQSKTRAKPYQVVVEAEDGSGEKPARQIFHINVINQPLVMKDGYQDGGRDDNLIIVNRDKAPAFLLGIAGIGEDTNRSYAYADLFMDPDGMDPVITIEKVSGDDTLQYNDNGTSVSFTADGAGEAVFRINAVDANDQTAAPLTYNVAIEAADAMQLVWIKLRIPIIILAVILLVILVILIRTFAGRKLYGVWDITSDSAYETDRKLGKTRSGKKAKCRLDSLLNDLNIKDGFGPVEVAAGNNLNKLVFFQNLGKLDYVELNGAEITNKKALKKLAVKPGQALVLQKDGMTVTFERHS